ncbi:MAG: hypothetical protein RL104_590 [Bacteroidota bacterium]
MNRFLRFSALAVASTALLVACEPENTCLECEASQVTTVTGEAPVTVPIGPLEMSGNEVDYVLPGPFTQTIDLGGVTATQVTTWTCQ